MVKVKLQRQKIYHAKYFSYVITIPQMLIDEIPELKDAEFVKINIEKKDKKKRLIIEKA